MGDVEKLAQLLMQDSVDRYVLVKGKDLWNLASHAFEADKISLAKFAQLVGVPRELLELKYPTEPVEIRLPADADLPPIKWTGQEPLSVTDNYKATVDRPKEENKFTIVYTSSNTEDRVVAQWQEGCLWAEGNSKKEAFENLKVKIDEYLEKKKGD